MATEMDHHHQQQQHQPPPRMEIHRKESMSQPLPRVSTMKLVRTTLRCPVKRVPDKRCMIIAIHQSLNWLLT